MTFNIYVRSYKRYDAICTEKLLDYCTYVVRKSEEELYRQAGVKSILAVEDEYINSGEKVLNYLIDNAPEDVIAVLDDDIHEFRYRLDEYETITDPVTVTMEIERLAQMVCDLGIGYGSVTAHVNLLYYDRPFKFVGINAAVKVFNREKVRGRFDDQYRFLSDDDFELQELMYNRIILLSQYFFDLAAIDKNEGGINSMKSQSMYDAEDEALSIKWGKYWQKADSKSLGGLRVKR